MDPRLQIRVQRYGWDAAMPYYEDAWRAQLRSAQDTLLDLATISADHDVLETACGTGLLTLRIADSVGCNGSILATDLSGKMINEIKRIASDGDYNNISFLRTSGEKLKLEDNLFDRAVCALGLMYMPDSIAALSEMQRTVKTSGKITVTVWGERKNCRWADIFPIVDAQVASDVCPLFFSNGIPGRLKTDMQNLGLSHIEERRQSTMLTFKNDKELLNAILNGGPVALAVNRFTAEVRQQVEDEFLASVQDCLQSDASYAIPGEFLTVCGTV